MTCGAHSGLRLLEKATSIQKDERPLPLLLEIQGNAFSIEAANLRHERDLYITRPLSPEKGDLQKRLCENCENISLSCDFPVRLLSYR
jgi:hypothetical protein